MIDRPNTQVEAIGTFWEISDSGLEIPTTPDKKIVVGAGKELSDDDLATTASTSRMAATTGRIDFMKALDDSRLSTLIQASQAVAWPTTVYVYFWKRLEFLVGTFLSV